MFMRILITGGAGFIGSNLCDYLLKEGNQVICVDNLCTGHISHIKHNLKNKNFIISGSSRGIGLGIAQILLKEGARCVITGRDEKSVVASVKGLKKKYGASVQFFIGDLKESKVLSRFKNDILSGWKRIDGIVANAGAVKPIADVELKDEDLNWYLDANLNVSYRFIRTFIPSLKKSKGAIVLISSIASIEDVGAPLPYSISKASINVLSKVLASRLAVDGVRVNTILPGNILFPKGNWDLKLKKNQKLIKNYINQNVPLKKFGTPQDIGNMTAYLLSEKANFITGSCFVIDGGQTSKIF